MIAPDAHKLPSPPTHVPGGIVPDFAFTEGEVQAAATIAIGTETLREMGYSPEQIQAAVAGTNGGHGEELLAWLLQHDEEAEHGPLDPGQATARGLPGWLADVLQTACPTNPRRTLFPALFQLTGKYSYHALPDPSVDRLLGEWNWADARTFGTSHESQALVIQSHVPLQAASTVFIAFTPAMVGAWRTSARAAKRSLFFPALEMVQLLAKPGLQPTLVLPDVDGEPCLAHGDVLRQQTTIWDDGLGAFLAGLAALPVTLYFVGYSYGGPKAQLSALRFRVAHPAAKATVRVVTFGGIRWMNPVTARLYRGLVGDNHAQFVGAGDRQFDPACGWPSKKDGYVSPHNEFTLDAHGNVQPFTQELDFKHSVTSTSGFQTAFLKLHFAYIKGARAASFPTVA